VTTSDLWDANRDEAIVCETQFRQYGAIRAFSGVIATVRCLEDNVLFKQCVAEPGNGRVLVADGGGSMRCALAGDNVIGAAFENGWAGVVINGCVRDVEDLGKLEIGVKALGSCPRPSGKAGAGELDVPVVFGAATFTPGHTLYSDEDGILVLPAS
jgi:regulator of ribonuclease activity A